MGTEKKASIDEIAIIALVEVQQGRTDEFEKIFEETIFETREEEGVVEFKLFKIKNRQNHYTLFERYTNQETLGDRRNNQCIECCGKTAYQTTC